MIHTGLDGRQYSNWIIHRGLSRVKASNDGGKTPREEQRWEAIFTHRLGVGWGGWGGIWIKHFSASRGEALLGL